jgi:hypothetical protein
MLGSSRVAAQMAASQKGLSSMSEWLLTPMFLKYSCSWNISARNNIAKNSNKKLKATVINKKIGHACTVLFHILKISLPMKIFFFSKFHFLNYFQNLTWSYLKSWFGATEQIMWCPYRNKSFINKVSILFILGMFNDTFKRTDYITLNDRVISE